MDPEKKNWRIRYHLPDAIVGLGKRLDTDSLRTKVIPFYNSLIKDTEHKNKVEYLFILFLATYILLCIKIACFNVIFILV